MSKKKIYSSIQKKIHLAYSRITRGNTMNKWFASLLLCISANELNAAVELEIQPKVILEETDRVGINLGTWTTWGGEQLSKNVLMNPGFEGYIDRVIVIISQSDKSSFSDQPDWGYDDDYWKGATFEVRTGTAKGTIGKITHSLRKGANGNPQYVTEKPLPPLDQKDIVTLTKISSEDPVPIWWIDEASKDRIHVDTDEKRPLSSGNQSLVLQPKADSPAEINFYLDAMADRVGKLLLVNGKWRFSFWMRSDTIDDSVHILFRRINGTKPFFEKIFPATNEWIEHTFDFDAQDTGDKQTLQLRIAAVGSGGKLWLDDMFLGPLQSDNDTNFRQEVIDALLKIKPSFIRDTQGQLGDSFENRIADIYARRATSTRAFAGARSLSTTYSIPDLLQLCQKVKSNPWIVVPPTFSNEEAFLLGQYLSQHASKAIFSTVIVEFGNENWNYVFRSTGIPMPQQHGYVAEAIFGQIQQGANGEVNLRTVVNGQHASPNTSKDFIQSTPNADAIAIAPYFFYTLNSGGATEQHLKEMFQDDGGLMKQLTTLVQPLNKKISTYETNLHTVKGTATEIERLSYTASQAAGSALAKRLLEGMLLGIQPEIVFDLAQFDADVEGGRGKVRLWGIVRDLTSERMRPQGLAVIMLNAVAGGNLQAVAPKEESAGLTTAVFKHNDQWKAAVVNATSTAQETSINFAEGKLPTSLWVLKANSPLDTNEDKENVTIVKETLAVDNHKVTFTIPAWGFVVLNDDAAIP